MELSFFIRSFFELVAIISVILMFVHEKKLIEFEDDICRAVKACYENWRHNNGRSI